MTIRNRYPLDLEKIINEIKSKKAYVVVPAILGFRNSAEILRGVISSPREKFLELERLVNSKEETAGIENLPLSVIPLFLNRLDRPSDYPPIPESFRKCIRDTFEHNSKDHKKSIMYFVTTHIMLTQEFMNATIEEVAMSPEYQNIIDEVRIVPF